MRYAIHPSYHTIQATCSCGASFQLFSTLEQPLKLEVCNHCHPFYIGKHRTLDASGRIERFNKRFQHLSGNLKNQ